MRQPPPYVLNCLQSAGDSFYKNLDALDWPDANRDAPAKEANIVLHVARELIQAEPTFHVYLEAATLGSGRLDLLATNNEIAIAIEAKCFGNIAEQAEALFDDVNRLKDFFPRYAKLKGDAAVEDWWRKVQNRWGIAVVASFRGDEVARAWKDRDANHLREKDRPGFEKLLDKLDLVNASRFAFQINDGLRWKECGAVYLLIAAFEI